ncbi:MAG TPA: STAS domain-containing protein [Gemmataceae bacterium]|nr:STAS domain-containing protein [Gemmataceae bacterium]
MADPPAKKVGCPVVVLSLNEPQINNDIVAESLRDELLALHTAVGAVHAIIDFQSVQYLSSAGFRPLLSLNRHVRERGGRLVLCNMQPQVEEVFTVTRLIDPDGKGRAAFVAQPTVPAAVAHVYQAEGAA